MSMVRIVVRPHPNGCLSAHCGQLPSLIAAIPGQMPRTKPVQAAHPICLLRARPKRTYDHSAAEHGYELPSTDADCHLTAPQWDHACCNVRQDSTLQNGLLRPTSRSSDGQRLATFA